MTTKTMKPKPTKPRKVDRPEWDGVPAPWTLFTRLGVSPSAAWHSRQPFEPFEGSRTRVAFVNDFGCFVSAIGPHGRGARDFPDDASMFAWLQGGR